jgi:hypothetical protein
MDGVAFFFGSDLLSTFPLVFFSAGIKYDYIIKRAKLPSIVRLKGEA